MPDRPRLFFWIPDLVYPCIEDPAFDASGHRIEISGRRPSEHVAGEVRLFWKFRTQPPDFLYHAAQKLFISERAMECWRLQDGEVTALRQLVLVDRKQEVLRKDYWWVDVRPEYAILDEEHSVVRRVGRALLSVEKFRVAWDRVPELALFLCREPYVPVFTAGLVERYRFCGLTGAVFVPVDGGSWPPAEPA